MVVGWMVCSLSHPMPVSFVLKTRYAPFMLLYQTYTNNQDAADNTLNRLLNHPGTLTNHAQSRARECNLTVIVAPHHAGCKHAILAPVVANMNNAKGLGDTRGTAISDSIICRPSDVALPLVPQVWAWSHFSSCLCRGCPSTCAVGLCNRTGLK